MKLNLDQQAEDAQIQIIPLIDVIFCILTFFILASLQMTRQQAINVDLPQAATGQVQQREMLVVTIDAAGQTYIDKQPIDPATLYDRLKQYRETNPEGLLVLNASQNAFYNDVIRVLDILRKVGGDKVALATIPETNSPNTQGSPIPGMPGTTFPGSPLPGNTNFPGAPGSGIPGSNFPGTPDMMPGSNIPGSNIPGSNIPGSNIPGNIPGSTNLPGSPTQPSTTPDPLNPTGQPNSDPNALPPSNSPTQQPSTPMGPPNPTAPTN